MNHNDKQQNHIPTTLVGTTSSVPQSSFASILREFRVKRGWTQKKLADELHERGVGASTVKRWESGKGRPQGGNIEALIKLTGKDAAELGLMRTTQEEDEATIGHEEAAVHIEEVEQEGVASAIAASAPHPRVQALSWRQRMNRYWLASLTAAVIFFSLLVTTFHLVIPRSQQPSVVGQISFESSYQVRDGSNEGINDILALTLQLSPSEQGKNYYAWLEPANRENPSIFLGPLLMHNGRATLIYRDAQHSNLLDFAAHVVVTQQDSASTLLGPSLQQEDQKYTADIPNIHPPVVASDPFSQEYSQYGLLDHVRHLVSSDPTLIQAHIYGGLVTVLNTQTHQMDRWAADAHDAWTSEKGPDANAIRKQVISIVNVLDGTATVDVPPTPVLVPSHAAHFALLPQPGQLVQESYLAHIDLHLRGVGAAPGASAQLRASVALLDEELSGIVLQFKHIRTNAEALYSMSDAQLHSTQALDFLNDLTATTDMVYAGPHGVFALFLAAQTLSTMDIFSCTQVVCQP